MPIFEYVGGGYYRIKSIPRGKPSPVVHGDEIMNVVLAYLVFGT